MEDNESNELINFVKIVIFNTNENSEISKTNETDNYSD